MYSQSGGKDAGAAEDNEAVVSRYRKWVDSY
jgi:hypothetical protein